MRLMIVGLSIALGVAACGPKADVPPTVDIKAEEAKLMAVSREWSALASAGKDVDAVAAYWADDATLMQDGMPTMHGRAAAREFVAAAFKIPGFKIDWEPVEAHVAASGDMGYLVERSAVTEPGVDGKPVVHRMRAVTVWRKDAAGQWRNVADISNADVPPK